MTALLLSILLIGTPSHDSVTVSKQTLRGLEERIDRLEKKTHKYEAAQGYYDMIQAGERAIWTAILTVIVGGVGLYSYKRFTDEVESVHEDFDNIKEDFESLRKDHLVSSASLSRVYANNHRDREDFWKAARNRIKSLSDTTKISDRSESIENAIEVSIKGLENEISKCVSLNVRVEPEEIQDRKDMLYNIMNRVESDKRDKISSIIQKMKQIPHEESETGASPAD